MTRRMRWQKRARAREASRRRSSGEAETTGLKREQMKTVNTEKKWRKRTNSGWERSRCTDESLNSAPVTKTVASVTSIRSEERCDGDVDDEATIAALQRLEPEPELEMGSTSEWMGEEEGTRGGEEGEEI